MRKYGFFDILGESLKREKEMSMVDHYDHDDLGSRKSRFKRKKKRVDLNQSNNVPEETEVEETERERIKRIVGKVISGTS